MRAKQTGFTLIEVIIAMSILAISITSLMELFTISLKGVRVSRETTFASILAKSKMSELMLQREVKPGGESGTFEQFGGIYDYETMIEEYELPNLVKEGALDFDSVSDAPVEEEDLYKTYKITVVVSWGGRKVTLTTIRVQYENPEAM